jgi:hypothetical protein
VRNAYTVLLINLKVLLIGKVQGDSKLLSGCLFKGHGNVSALFNV